MFVNVSFGCPELDSWMNQVEKANWQGSEETWQTSSKKKKCINKSKLIKF